MKQMLFPVRSFREKVNLQSPQALQIYDYK